jgi:sulfide dehydrogenase [flavocytochrome c] flavoprotein subunit
MHDKGRREFIKRTAALGVAAGLNGLGAPAIAKGNGGRVVIIGGGYGGTIAAKYIRRMDPSIEVTLVEQNRTFVSCPFSNKVIAGMIPISDVTFSYDALRDKHGVDVVHSRVKSIDTEKRRVKAGWGKRLDYDRLIVSPGIDLRYDTIENYDEDVAERIPHAWAAGKQTIELRDQLQAMDDGGLVVIAAPPNPFRCPPGPYERASLIAHYLKMHKPRSKILILDSKDKFSKQGLFQAGWDQLYPGMIEWVSNANDGRVLALASKGRMAITEFGEHKADVLNVIPAQQAGAVAREAGLTDESGWCPVNQMTFASTLAPNVYVIGDASIAGKMPKSGYAANTQAKVCAAAVVADLQGKPFAVPAYTNTCYSVLAPDYGISVAAVYELSDEGTIVGVEGAGGLSAMHAPPSVRGQEAVYAQGWFNAITSDMFT